MSDFLAFARSHGLIMPLGGLITGRWVAVRTEDKPKKKNGRYYLDSRGGAVQNWATMEKAEGWKPGNELEVRHDPERLARLALEEKQRRKAEAERHASAATRAHEMLSTAKPETHGYLASKGFPDLEGLVLDGALLIRMADCQTGKVAGLQTISPDPAGGWVKKFLPGTRAKGAVHRRGRGDKKLLCEGFATALSVESAVKSLAFQAEVIVCFSAGNIPIVAGLLGGPVGVCADNDASKAGQTAAEKTGKPWRMPDATGTDFNDLAQAEGLFVLRGKIAELLRLLNK